MILVYSKEEAKRNAFAVNKFTSLLGAKLVTPDYRGSAKCVINRSNDYKIAKFYEERGVRVFNPAEFTKIANDKQLCYDFMEEKGVEIMKTRYSDLPFIKKPRSGHGGEGVIWCESKEDYDENSVCQKPATDLGKDLRVWVLGGEIISSFLRISKTDFRSNFCLGGDAVLYELSENEEKEVKKIISLIKGDYFGIDFVFNNSKIVFNELEDAVGARILYEKSNIDILSLYCDYIKRELAKK